MFWPAFSMGVFLTRENLPNLESYPEGLWRAFPDFGGLSLILAGFLKVSFGGLIFSTSRHIGSDGLRSPLPTSVLF